jgi:hypothetical protein
MSVAAARSKNFLSVHRKGWTILLLLLLSQRRHVYQYPKGSSVLDRNAEIGSFELVDSTFISVVRFVVGVITNAFNALKLA